MKMNYDGSQHYLRHTLSNGVAPAFDKFAGSSDLYRSIVDQSAYISGLQEIWGTTFESLYDRDTDSPDALTPSMRNRNRDCGVFLGSIASKQFLNGNWICKTNKVGATTGWVEVNDTAILHEGLKLKFVDKTTSATTKTGVISAFDYDSALSSKARSGSAFIKIVASLDSDTAVDMSSITAGSKAFVVNQDTTTNVTRPVSLRDVCFSSTNGGSDSIYNKTKKSIRWHQSLSVDGSSLDTAKKFIDAVSKLQIRYNNTFPMKKLRKCFVSYDNYEPIRTYADSISNNDLKSVRPPSYTYYPYETMSVKTQFGQIEITALRELENDVAFLTAENPSQSYTPGNKPGKILTNGSLVKLGPTNHNSDEAWVDRDTTNGIYKFLRDTYLQYNLIVDPCAVAGIYAIDDDLAGSG